MYLEKFKLDGKTAIVTGAGQGIGLACAEALAEAGAKVIIGDRDPKAANEAKAALNESIPLGWSSIHPGWESIQSVPLRWVLFVVLKIVGLIVTVLAIMMGAPFWFDVLNKISNLRGSGAKPASSTDDKK